MTRPDPTKKLVLEEMRRIHAGKLKVPTGEQLTYLQSEIAKIKDPVSREALEILFLSTKESYMGVKINGDVHGSSATPWGVLQEAIRAVPAVKYALGIAGVVSVIAIIGGFKIGFRVAAVGAVVMLILMTVLLLFARLSIASNRSVAAAGVFFLWSSVILFVGTAALLFTSVFFQRPLDLRKWLVGSADRKQADALQNSARAPIQEKPKPVDKATQRVLVGSNFGLQVDGYESRGQRFSVAAPGELDQSKGSPRGFDLEVTGNNGHGVRKCLG